MSETIDPRGQSVPQDAAEVGRLLSAGRQARGLTIANVAQMLKLGVRQIEAMESGRFDLLPGAAFARGFVRNYARLLGIDADPLVAVVDAGVTAQVDLAPVSNAEGVMPASGAQRLSSTPVALVAFGLLLVVLVGWYFDWFRTPDAPPDTVAQPAVVETAPPTAVAQEQPSETQPAPALDAAGTPAAKPPATLPEVVTNPAAERPASPAPQSPAPAGANPGGEAASSADGLHTVELTFAGESWYEIRDADGKIVATGIGRADQVRSARGSAPLALVIGNAAMVRLTHNGQAVDLAPHTRVSVARLTLQ
ncbi:MAG TPA: DUF4115 domain-containing protein [Pseudothauera hydrothermalis]|uniref:RodZ domain-containing protein n=1 Tax=Pseudothauera hydrothermalis TaxID=2184083 RepID=UPI000CA28D04|nr:RodZ domain-containing protein [Pseudothauera hydrothermalis]AUL99267.1 hypothetical protein B4966_03025 [Rhodocyclaceae bacterium]HNQ76521.1 DUF4115 domain-containing protein [Pseudothauera hydrothermalis]